MFKMEKYLKQEKLKYGNAETAYKLVKSMNEELASQGYITMAGRIPRAYWAKKMYGYELSVG